MLEITKLVFCSWRVANTSEHATRQHVEQKTREMVSRTMRCNAAASLTQSHERFSMVVSKNLNFI